MLSLIEMTPEEIERIVQRVPGGAQNIQDIYPLAPLQEGILFHYLMGGEGDPYLLASQMSFESRARLDAYLEALQAVIDRHDILRTAVMWEGLREPAQVVWRKALLRLEEVKLDEKPGDAAEQMYSRFDPKRNRIDVREAPLMRAYAGYDEENKRWLLLMLLHHLVGDQTTDDVIQEEIEVHLLAQETSLSAPLPFRNLVAQARLGIRREEHEAFFRKMLGDVEEPTAPFGLLDVQGDGSGIEEGRLALDGELAVRLRGQARRLGVSAASLCHLAWAMVLSKVSGRKDVVFGTVLFGRMQGGEGVGLFINTLPLRIDLGEQSVEAGVHKTHALLGDLMRHEHAPLALAQRCSGVPAPAPLFSALLNYRHSSGAAQARSAEAMKAWEGIRWLRSQERTNYPLTLSVDDLGEGFMLTAQVQAATGPMRVCEYMRTALQVLVRALETAPATTVRTLDVLPASERRQVLYQWNDKERKYVDEQTVVGLFELQVERNAEAIAVEYEHQEISYGELNRRTNRLAHFLRSLRIGPEDVVGICLERSVEMVVGLLGILKAGGAYVPLDPAYPAERLQYMLKDAGVEVVVTGAELKGSWLSTGMRCIDLDAEREEIARWPEGNVQSRITSENLAYIIYTSGSTGIPKGTAVPHRSLMGFMCDVDYVTFDEKQTLFQHSSTSWDALTLELWPALVHGGKCVLHARETITANDLRDAIRHHGVTLLWLTSALFNSIMDSDPDALAGLKQLMVGGEALSPTHIWKALQFLPETRIVNGYGPSECTVFATCYAIPPQAQPLTSIPIGRPIGDRQVFLLDENLTLVPIGVAGEIFIGGHAVARGYVGRPQLTAEKFIPDPFSREPGRRMYRTGDLGRWRPDGNLEFLGRRDEQVKIRGFRIELGEIEAALRGHPGIAQSTVVVREHYSGDKQLIGYVVARTGQQRVGETELRRYLSKKLPGYMVPAAIVEMAKLPLTMNGKLDKRELPAPEFFGNTESRGPRTPEEEVLCRLFEDVLGVEQVGIDDNFFELGGHSLLAMRLVSRIRSILGVELTIRTLLDEPSVHKLVPHLKRGEAVHIPVRRQMRPEHIPLSYAQQRLWFLDRLQGTSQEYNVPEALQLRGKLDVNALRMAVNAIIARHESLRTHFAEVEGKPVQVIVPELQLDLAIEDLSGLQKAEQAIRVTKALQQEAEQAFDLSRGPLLRMKLLKLAEEEHVLLKTIHHIVWDGWSEGVFNQECKVLYEAFQEGRELRLNPLPVQYADYALWQREYLSEAVMAEELAYWKEQLQGIPEELHLAKDRQRWERQTFVAEVCQASLSSECLAGLKRLSQKHNATLYMTLLAVYGMLLGRYSGEDDILIGSPIANRREAQLEKLIGFFVNSLVMRVRIHGEESFEELLSQVRSTAVGAYQHQELPFERLVEELSPQRSLNKTPIYQVTFTMQNAPMGRQELKGLEIEAVAVSTGTVRCDLELHAWEEAGNLELYLVYNRELFEPGRIEQMTRHYVRLLEAVTEHPGIAVCRLEMVEGEEREVLLREWSGEDVEYPRRGVHELFEEQAERTPEAVAVKAENKELSYRELNERANQVAHHLLGLGVGAEVVVGICMERSVDAVIAMLGVLKTGGAYLPLDPSYPEERLGVMLEESSVAVLLTVGELRERLPVSGAQVIEMDGKRKEIEQERKDNPGLKARADQAAYVMYTSGSTGKPKGIVVEHRGIVRLVKNQSYVRLGRLTRLLQLAPLSFDASTFEIWGVLLNGGSLVIIAKTRLSAKEIGDALRDFDINTLWLTSGLFQEVVHSELDAFAGVHQLLAGGDVLSADHVRRVVHAHPQCQVINGYGPTENTTFTCCYRIPSKRQLDAGTIPIGHAIANTRVYVLDRQLEPVPAGTTGELYVSGAGLARGYVKQAGMTGERFVANPYGEAGGRMYRTGDLVQWNMAGELEFIGRVDQQVKLRGYRIELGEIETVLGSHGGVKQAAVSVREDRPRQKRLVGYVVLTQRGSVGEAELRQYLEQRLPEYMVPVSVMELEALPLTANGKLDRKALPRPDMTSDEKQYRAPRNETEEILCGIWGEVLGVERVGIGDNFFKLGGDSILSIQIVARARKAGLEFSVQDLFEHQTIAELATVVRQEKGKQEIVSLPFELVGEEVFGRLPEDIEDAYPLTRLQAGMLFHSDFAPGSRIYHIIIGWRVNLRYDSEKFQQAVNRLTRHEMLRTSIDMTSFTEPLQLVHRHVDLNVVEQDWRMKTAAEQAVGLNDFIERESMTPFLWKKAPLLRIFLHWLSESEFQCSFSFHHAILDGWSDASLITELLQDYERQLTGEALEPRFVGVRYRDYVALERHATSSKESATFWKQMLEGCTVTPVPLKDWRGAEKPAGEILRIIAISSGTQDRLQYIAREMGIPLKTVLLSAHLKALQVLSGQLDITTGVVMNGRPEVEGGEQAIGFFLNTVPFRLRVDHRDWKSLIRETFAAEQQILPHRRYPMIDLKVQLGRSALFETAFNYVHFHIHQKLERGQKDRTIIGEPSGCGQTSLGFFVNFEVSPETGELRGIVQCDTGIMSVSAVERAARYYQSILVQINEDEIGDVRPHEERAQVERWNRTDTEIDDACVHLLFERQTDKMPEAVAVVYKDTSVSYGELNRQANQLAHYLLELGVKPDTRVAICVDRTPEMIIGLLGILKAGGAYVPLDPAYPVDRLKYMLQDSEPAVLLTQTSIQKQFSDFRKPMSIIDISATSCWRDRPELNFANNTIGLNANHLAYVIYTSGSTGMPKGVMGTQRGMLNRLQWMWEHFPFNHDDIGCAKTSLGFLDSFWEIFGYLLQGKPVVLVGNEAAKDPEQLIQQMEVNRVTRVVLVPTLLQAILDYGSNVASRLQYLRFWVTSGEKLPSDLAYNFHEALPGARLFNLYGCSEVSADSTWHETNQTTDGIVPLGRPITNTQVYILDENQEPVPVGVVGEIYIGGAGVARGYLKRPELTASSFLPNPFREQKGERMYRTGDLGRWQENGEIESFGRNDHQVKIRGFRIELGEIEARLAEHPSVSEAVVLMRQDQPGDKRLVAYVSPKVQNGFVAAVDPEALSTRLSSCLPHYMVPAAYAVLERLPRTTTGKLDRKALPAPNADAYVGRAYEEPLGEMEIMMARIWADVLKVDRVGRNDNFFQIGGHSLLIVKMANSLRQHEIVATVADIFNHPTLKSFSAFVHSMSPSAPCHGAVCIQQGTQTPLFLVHDGYGDELYFSVLAQYLPQELPVYGLPSLSPGEPLLHTMQALAERMVNLIQEVQPEGPYRLAGWSFGGVLAYEIAQHLLDQGQTLEFLGLIDAFCPDGRDEENNHERTPDVMLMELCKGRRCEGSHGNSGTLALDEFERNMNFDELFNHYRVLQMLPENFEHLSSDEARLQCHNLGIYSLAMAVYRPRPIGIPVHLFVANERLPGLPIASAALGWEHCVPMHLLHAHAVPGSHRSMMKVPQIKTLGQRLAEALAAALRETAKFSSATLDALGRWPIPR